MGLAKGVLLIQRGVVSSTRRQSGRVVLLNNAASVLRLRNDNATVWDVMCYFHTEDPFERAPVVYRKRGSKVGDEAFTRIIMAIAADKIVNIHE